MKRSFLLLALVFFAPAAAAYGQDTVEAYNTSIIAGRSQALSVLDGTGEDAWPFDKKFHIILNVAIGGDWGGAQGVDPNVWPRQMRVDYVRVYRK